MKSKYSGFGVVGTVSSLYTTRIGTTHHLFLCHTSIGRAREPFAIIPTEEPSARNELDWDVGLFVRKEE